MKWLVRDSIAARTILVLLVGLTVSHMLSVTLYFMDRAEALTTSGEAHVGERIATIVQLIEKAPKQERRRILEYTKSPSMEITRSQENITQSGGVWNSSALRGSLDAHLERMGGRNFTIRYADDHKDDRTDNRNQHDDERPIYASVQLKDGSWLNFSSFVEAPEPFWSARFALSILVMMVPVLILSALVVHHLTAPLRVFSHAAEQLGLDIRAPSLQETGPKEVRRVTRAFNEMQNRITKLIDDRTRMLAAISHDLRTPITRLRLRADFIDDEEQNEKALRDLDEMEDMISSLMSFAREEVDEEPREIVDLSTLIGSVCDDLIDTGSEISFAGEGSLPYSCNRLALRRAFTNLLENAVRYGERARVTLSVLGEWVVVRIDDDGPGIPEAEREKAFDPFYRIEPSRNRETGGTGVGLYVARTIVRSHGGDVELENQKGGGLRVSVSLPQISRSNSEIRT